MCAFSKKSGACRKGCENIADLFLVNLANSIAVWRSSTVSSTQEDSSSEEDFIIISAIIFFPLNEGGGVWGLLSWSRSIAHSIIFFKNFCGPFQRYRLVEARGISGIPGVPIALLSYRLPSNWGCLPIQHSSAALSLTTEETLALTAISSSSPLYVEVNLQRSKVRDQILAEDQRSNIIDQLGEWGWRDAWMWGIILVSGASVRELEVGSLRHVFLKKKLKNK